MTSILPSVSQNGSLRQACAIAALPLYAMLFVGCGEPDAQWNQTYPVTGSVFIAGKPAGGAQVVLYPLSADGELLEQATRSSGSVTEDGSYEVTTYQSGDGAPAGEYAVTILWPSEAPAAAPDELGPDRLEGRYSDPDNPVDTITVNAGENELEPIRLE